MSFKVQTLSNWTVYIKIAWTVYSLFKPWTMGLSKEGSSKTVDDFQSQTSQQSISHNLELYIVCAVDDFENYELDLSYKLFLTTVYKTQQCMYVQAITKL